LPPKPGEANTGPTDLAYNWTSRSRTPMTLLAVSAITGFLFFVPPDSAASGNIKQMLETFLSQKDLKQAPELGWLDDRLDALRLEPAADVAEFCPSFCLCSDPRIQATKR